MAKEIISVMRLISGVRQRKRSGVSNIEKRNIWQSENGGSESRNHQP
jgi:hypothetical protein